MAKETQEPRYIRFSNRQLGEMYGALKLAYPSMEVRSVSHLVQVVADVGMKYLAKQGGATTHVLTEELAYQNYTNLVGKMEPVVDISVDTINTEEKKTDHSDAIASALSQVTNKDKE